MASLIHHRHWVVWTRLRVSGPSMASFILSSGSYTGILLQQPERNKAHPQIIPVMKISEQILGY